MKINKKEIIKNIFFPLLSLAMILVIWIIAYALKGNPLVLPSPLTVAESFFTIYKSNNFWLSVFSTLLRTFLAFIISFVLAYITSFLSYKFNSVGNILSPMISVLRAAPTVAVILILYAFMRTKTMTVVIGFLIAFPILHSSFRASFNSLDENYEKMCKVYKVKKFSRFINLYFLSILNELFEYSKSTLSLTLKVVIAAEILTFVSPSLGGKIQSSYATFDISYLLAWTILAIILSFAIELFVILLKKICVRWGK